MEQKRREGGKRRQVLLWYRNLLLKTINTFKRINIYSRKLLDKMKSWHRVRTVLTDAYEFVDVTVGKIRPYICLFLISSYFKKRCLLVLLLSVHIILLLSTVQSQGDIIIVFEGQTSTVLLKKKKGLIPGKRGEDIWHARLKRLVKNGHNCNCLCFCFVTGQHVAIITRASFVTVVCLLLSFL